MTTLESAANASGIPGFARDPLEEQICFERNKAIARLRAIVDLACKEQSYPQNYHTMPEADRIAALASWRFALASRYYDELMRGANSVQADYLAKAKELRMEKR